MDFTAPYLKSLAINWLRYGKRLPLVCSEVGGWNADVLGLSPQIAVEVETKISKSDIKAEFDKKTAKHWLYANPKSTSSIPNYFYFLVPEHLADFTRQFLEDKMPKAGVISALKPPSNAKHYDKTMLAVVKRATKIKDGPPTKYMFVTTLLRCSSELAGLYWSRHMTYSREDENVAQYAAMANGTLDIEEPSNDLELRACELAYAIDGITPTVWENIAIEEKERWLTAAARMLDAKLLKIDDWYRYRYDL